MGGGGPRTDVEVVDHGVHVPPAVHEGDEGAAAHGLDGGARERDAHEREGEAVPRPAALLRYAAAG